MVRFCANVTLLFAEIPFLERFQAARTCGFDAVELQSPYDFEPDRIAAELERNELTLVLFNTPSGNVAAGDRGLATDPTRIDEFKISLAQTLLYARVLKPEKINCIAGRRLDNVDPDIQRATLIDNLRYAADATAAEGIQLMIEPLNPFDAPGFYVSTPSIGFDLVREVDHPNLGVEYDIYHAQRTEGQITSTIRANLDRIAHIQLADAPERHEPGTGELNWAYIFAETDDAGYQGRIGVEYIPSTSNTAETLTWMEAYR